MTGWCEKVLPCSRRCHASHTELRLRSHSSILISLVCCSFKRKENGGTPNCWTNTQCLSPLGHISSTIVSFTYYTNIHSLPSVWRPSSVFTAWEWIQSPCPHGAWNLTGVPWKDPEWKTTDEVAMNRDHGHEGSQWEAELGTQAKHGRRRLGKAWLGKWPLHRCRRAEQGRNQRTNKMHQPDDSQNRATMSLCFLFHNSCNPVMLTDLQRVLRKVWRVILTVISRCQCVWMCVCWGCCVFPCPHFPNAIT